MNLLCSHIKQLRTAISVFCTVILFVLLIPACDQHKDKFHPTNTLDNKIFVVGSQIDGSNNLVLYVYGTDDQGEALTEDVLQTAEVSVTTSTGATKFVNGDGQLTIEPVSALAAGNAKILSLSLLTDYSGSIDDNELADIGDVFVAVLDNLPKVYEAQIINFSDTYKLELNWTEASQDYNAIIAATALDDTIRRNGTALYDSIGYALLGDTNVVGSATEQGDGLTERCRPAHMMVVFTDGKENPQPNSPNVYTDAAALAALIDSSQTTTVMLGTSDADLPTLETFAAANGAVVQMNNTEEIKTETSRWAQSLNHMVQLTLAATSQYQGNTVSIDIGGQQFVVASPSDAFCKVAQ